MSEVERLARLLHAIKDGINDYDDLMAYDKQILKRNAQAILDAGYAHRSSVGLDEDKIRYIVYDRNPIGMQLHEVPEQLIEALAAAKDEIIKVRNPQKEG